MNSRLERYKAFDNFRETSKEVFSSFSADDPSATHLDDLFSFCICPGGRDGGLNKKIVEVFYGNRPIDSTTQIGPNAGLISKLECAYGATLAYFRTDDGFVVCNLYPAGTDNQKSLEDGILLGHFHPDELKMRAHSHWKFFIAYMEATCIDGSPKLVQDLRVFYLRNFKRYIVDSKTQDRKAIVLLKDIFKWVVTVGLSGFILLLVSQLKSETSKQQELEHHKETIEVLSASEKELGSISLQIHEMKTEISEASKELHNLSQKAAEQAAQKVHKESK